MIMWLARKASKFRDTVALALEDDIETGESMLKVV